MHARDIDSIPLPPHPAIEQYDERANSLAAAASSAESGAIHGWARDWLESLADARLYIAHVHGFASWPKFVEHVHDIACESPISRFESAADAVVTGDVDTLHALIEKDPPLVRARSSRAHGATLLHYIAANGHEGYRQKTPKNAVEVARVLLGAGAKVDATAQMYGLACTTMEMLVSSTPPAAAGVQVDLVDTLLDYGAAPNGVDDDGSPLMTALAFRFPASARALARRGARVDNVIAAAALGRLDLLELMVDDAGALRPGVPLVAGPWPRPGTNPATHVAYAMAYAAWCGPLEAVELLLRKGVDPSSSDHDGPALSWAAGAGRMSIVRLLIAHGASLEVRNRYGGTVLGATLWLARNAPMKGVNYVAVIDELIALGANVDAYPELKQAIETLRGSS